jgi:hypothetical protein
MFMRANDSASHRIFRFGAVVCEKARRRNAAGRFAQRRPRRFMYAGAHCRIASRISDVQFNFTLVTRLIRLNQGFNWQFHTTLNDYYGSGLSFQ